MLIHPLIYLYLSISIFMTGFVFCHIWRDHDNWAWWGYLWIPVIIILIFIIWPFAMAYDVYVWIRDRK